jgi:hypothetical protein
VPTTLTAAAAPTFADIAAIASDLTDRRIEFAVIDLDRWLAAQISSGQQELMARFLLGMYEAAHEGYFAGVDPLLGSLLARTPRTVRDLLASSTFEERAAPSVSAPGRRWWLMQHITRAAVAVSAAQTTGWWTLLEEHDRCTRAGTGQTTTRLRRRRHTVLMSRRDTGPGTQRPRRSGPFGMPRRTYVIVRVVLALGIIVVGTTLHHKGAVYDVIRVAYLALIVGLIVWRFSMRRARRHL